MRTLKINAYIFLLSLAMLALTGCSFINEPEMDCDPYYKVKFRFDMNILEADAFSSQVGEVDLYVLDAEDGSLVWHGHEEGEPLSREGYLMELPVAPGKYRLVAWARKRYDGAADFAMEGGRAPMHFSQLKMSLERQYVESRALSTTHIHSLFHGIVNDVELPDEYGEHVVTVPLVKDTNSIRIMLVHLDGSEFKENEFDFKITDINADLDYDNAILDTELVEYRAWAKRLGLAQTILPTEAEGNTESSPQTRAQTSVHSLIAEMTTSRLQTCRKPMLTVTRTSDGKKVIEIPINDYFLMVKGEYRRGWSDDEFLDRQDDYSMTFFMHEDGTWFDAVLNILQWRIVRQSADL